MERIARVIVSHSRPILAATALISLVAVTMLFRMQFNADISSFALTGSEAGESLVELQEKYNTGDPINVVVTLPEGETFRSKAGLVTLVELRDQILAVEGVGGVATIVPDENPITGEPISAVAIGSAPEQAIVPEGSRQYVYVVSDGVVEKRQVQLGRRIPGFVVIAEGLAAGESVVTEGTHKVRDGAEVETLEAKAALSDTPAGAR